MTPGRLAFVLGAVTGIAAVLLEYRFHVGAAALVTFCLGALLTIVAALGGWAARGHPS